jgi:hypothetical protein
MTKLSNSMTVSERLAILAEQHPSVSELRNASFRIVKRENNIPVLGVCEYCNAEFAADPETIGRPKDAHAHIQKQFIAHKCKQLDASQKSQNAMRVVPLPPQ